MWIVTTRSYLRFEDSSRDHSISGGVKISQGHRIGDITQKRVDFAAKTEFMHAFDAHYQQTNIPRHASQCSLRQHKTKCPENPGILFLTTR